MTTKAQNRHERDTTGAGAEFTAQWLVTDVGRQVRLDDLVLTRCDR